jgi:hypothetical protein
VFGIISPHKTNWRVRHNGYNQHPQRAGVLDSEDDSPQEPFGERQEPLDERQPFDERPALDPYRAQHAHLACGHLTHHRPLDSAGAGERLG